MFWITIKLGFKKKLLKKTQTSHNWNKYNVDNVDNVDGTGSISWCCLSGVKVEIGADVKLMETPNSWKPLVVDILWNTHQAN